MLEVDSPTFWVVLLEVRKVADQPVVHQVLSEVFRVFWVRLLDLNLDQAAVQEGFLHFLTLSVVKNQLNRLLREELEDFLLKAGVKYEDRYLD